MFCFKLLFYVISLANLISFHGFSCQLYENDSQIHISFLDLS